jgi:hypothetical protein
LKTCIVRADRAIPDAVGRLSALALLVLPVARLALGQPFDGLVHAAQARRFGLRFHDPRHVLALEAVAAGLEHLERRLVGLERLAEVVRHGQGLRRRPGPGRRLDALVVELHGTLDDCAQFFLRRQILDRRDAPELPHRFLLGRIREQDLAFPEAERAVRREGRHLAQHALVLEMRTAPLDRLFDRGTGRVDDLAQMGQDRLREGGGRRDVGVNAGIEGRHGPNIAALKRAAKRPSAPAPACSWPPCRRRC